MKAIFSVSCLNFILTLLFQFFYLISVVIKRVGFPRHSNLLNTHFMYTHFIPNSALMS